MQKPAETRTFALTSAIFCAAAMVIQFLIVVLAPLFSKIFPHYGSVGAPDAQGTVFLLLACLRNLPIAVLAFWFSRQTEILSSQLNLTAIAAPVLYFGGGLLYSVSHWFAFRLITSAEAYGRMRLTESYMNMVNFAYGVGFILLCCAIAIEYYLHRHTPSDGESS